MKIILFSLSFLFIVLTLHAQNGLENVIVEKYYISNANDTTVNIDGGVLPVGSITYRIYADMLPGYKFQAAYGVNTVGAAHELRIATTTLFFNNEDRGATTPTFSKTNAKNNTVMLDSWLSVGAACTGNFGILKNLDDGVATNVNNDGVLQNNDPLAGIPLTSQDGLIAVAGRTPEAVTAVGITTEMAMFDNQNDGTNGPVFSTWNGSWASLNGSIGPDSIDNKVLIAQMTTDGNFSFELNIQIGTPTGGVENYVAKNPVGIEILMASLSYSTITSVTENQTAKNSTLNVYPNPANDFVTLSVNPAVAGERNDYIYTIYGVTGNLVLQKHLGNITEKHLERIDVSSLSTGLYFIELSINGTKSTNKIVKN